MVIWHVLLIIPVLGGEFSAHFFNGPHHSFPEVITGIEEHGRNYLYNIDAIQP